MKYTSAEAGKLIKKLEDEIRRLQENEAKSATFRAASTEDPESLRPAYDFAETQERIAALQAELRAAKHAVNVFNTTHTLPGFEDLTIDQALVLLPQLNAQKEKLRVMAARLPISWIMSRQVPTVLFHIGLGVPASSVAGIVLCGVYFAVLQRRLRVGN